MSRGAFVTFEGVEGCGKSTQVVLLADVLRPRGYRVVVTREPGGTPLGEKLRDLLLHPGTDPVPEAELFMLEAARAQLCRRVVLPALDDGAVVIADRFADSSLAYQAAARGLDWDAVAQLNGIACGSAVPDRTLILDIALEDALARARHRPSTTGDNRRFEDETLAFHRAVERGYRTLASREPRRVRLVDGKGTPDEVHRRVWEAVADLFE